MLNNIIVSHQRGWGRGGVPLVPLCWISLWFYVQCTDGVLWVYWPHTIRSHHYAAATEQYLMQCLLNTKPTKGVSQHNGNLLALLKRRIYHWTMTKNRPRLSFHSRLSGLLRRPLETHGALHCLLYICPYSYYWFARDWIWTGKLITHIHVHVQVSHCTGFTLYRFHTGTHPTSWSDEIVNIK